MEKSKAELCFFSKRQLQQFLHRNRGVLYMLLAQMCSALMATTARILRTNHESLGYHALGTSEILLLIMGITMVLTWLYIGLASPPNAPFGPSGTRGLLLIRGVAGFFGIWGFYYSLRYMALAEATVFNFLSPLVAILVLHLYFYRSSVFPQLFAGLVSIIGVLLVVKPWSPHPVHSPYEYRLAVGMALLGVAGAALSYIAIAALGERVHPIITVGYFATVCTALNVLFLGFSSETHIHFPGSASQWFLVISLGVMGFIMNWLLTASLVDGKESGVVLNCAYVQIVFALLTDKLIWNILPDGMGYLGSSFILCSVVYVTNTRRAHISNCENQV